MDGLEWKTLLKWMIWGYPYFLETSIYTFKKSLTSIAKTQSCVFFSRKMADKNRSHTLKSSGLISMQIPKPTGLMGKPSTDSKH